MDNQNFINESELGDLLANSFNDFCKIYKNESSKNNNMDSFKQSNSETNDIRIKDTSANDDDDDILQDNLSKLAKSCNETVDKDVIQESLLSTLKIISDKAKSIAENEQQQSHQNPEQMLADNEMMSKMMENLMKEFQQNTIDDNDGEMKENLFELNKIMPLMSNIMENLLSKDFLYPTLSELRTKYPKYLSENQKSLSKDDYQRYENQLKIITKICEEFENDDYDDGGNKDDNDEQQNRELKTIRFNKILSLMQTMQTFGTPPQSLITNTSPNTEMMLDNLKMMNFDSSNKQQQQCNVM
uniref:Peroxin-19 n=1 Tax=Psoroptes ovis TaxID=83912 RepID=A0A3B0QPE3_PSOOV|nr:peroxisomal biogenesis factor 19 [Psoroptes ovis]